MVSNKVVLLFFFIMSSLLLYPFLHPFFQGLQKTSSFHPDIASTTAHFKDACFLKSKNFPFFLFASSLPLSSEIKSKSSQSGAAPLSSNSSPQLSPAWWEISLLLHSEGEYVCKEGKQSYKGDYSLTCLWTGCMEQDMDDYLIYHETCDLLEWKAQEKSKSPESQQYLAGNDFSGKPSFDFHYILRRGKNLHFNFQVHSFYVPQNYSDHKFYLILPASEENIKDPSKFDYNSFVIKGSNSVFLEENDIYHDKVEKFFTWKWKHHNRLQTGKRPVSFSNSHKVEVKVSITPHQ